MEGLVSSTRAGNTLKPDHQKYHSNNQPLERASTS